MRISLGKLYEFHTLRNGKWDLAMNKLKQIWSNLRSSFWFLPSLIVAVSIALAEALIEVDSTGLER